MARGAAFSPLFSLPRRKRQEFAPLPRGSQGPEHPAAPLLWLALCLFMALPPAARAASIQTPDAERIAAVRFDKSYCVRNGTLWGWGKNFFPDQADSSTPQPLLAGVRAVSANLLLKDDGSVWGWGSNSHGQLGIRPAKWDTHECFPLSRILDGVRRIDSAGNTHFALKRDGALWRWGFADDQGSFPGDKYFAEYSCTEKGGDRTPGKTDVMDGLQDIVLTPAAVFALKKDGTLWAWGGAGFGLPGAGKDTLTAKVPMRILSRVTAVTATRGTGMALREDGSLWAWGGNSNGQPGDGGAETRYVPVPVGFGESRATPRAVCE